MAVTIPQFPPRIESAAKRRSTIGIPNRRALYTPRVIRGILASWSLLPAFGLVLGLILSMGGSPAPPVGSTPGPPGVPRAALPPPGEMERCYRLIQARHFVAARVRLAPIVESHPGWQRAKFLLGLSFHEEGRYAEARPYFERALSLDADSPDVPAIRLHLAWTLYYLGETAGSREQLEALLSKGPAVADAHFALGLLEFDADRVESAAKQFQRAIELAVAVEDPRTEGKARARLADVLVRNGDLERAKTELQAAVRLRPDAYEAYFKLSRVLERLGDHEGAARALEQHHTIREQVRPSLPRPAETP
jgi:tetratricopeptide (TPR) repeat protein